MLKNKVLQSATLKANSNSCSQEGQLPPLTYCTVAWQLLLAGSKCPLGFSWRFISNQVRIFCTVYYTTYYIALK